MASLTSLELKLLKFHDTFHENNFKVATLSNATSERANLSSKMLKNPLASIEREVMQACIAMMAIRRDEIDCIQR